MKNQYLEIKQRKGILQVVELGNCMVTGITMTVKSGTITLLRLNAKNLHVCMRVCASLSVSVCVYVCTESSGIENHGNI